MNSTPDSRTHASLPLWLIAMALLLIAAFLGMDVFRRQERTSGARDQARVQRDDRPKTPATRNETAVEFKRRLAAIGPKSRATTNATGQGNQTNPVDAGQESATAQAATIAPVPAPAVASANDASSAGLVAANVSGEVFGKVTLVGTPPPEIVVDLSADPRCAAAHSEPVTTRHYVVSPDGGLANVLVYVKRGLEGRTFAVSTGTPVLDQIGCEFQPYVIGVQVNQKLLIKNSDPTLHNVHATAHVNQEFNLAEPIQGQVIGRSFPLPEIFIRFRCDVHPWMFAYVAVLAHPFFAVTGKDGAFQLPPGLPGGRYTLAAVHVKAGEITQEVAVSEGRAPRVDFALQVPP